jgi:hypothetical protein
MINARNSFWAVLGGTGDITGDDIWPPTPCKCPDPPMIEGIAEKGFNSS